MAKSRSLQRAVRFALATAASAAAGVTAVHAQEAPAPAPAANAAPIEEVVVTGSRLANPNETSISTITSVSAVDIQQTGYTRVEDILNNMPQVFAGMNSTTSNGADGTATVDLRGLGNQRTLVLVNGLRLGPGSALGGRNFSDINQIPTALIERVDIVTGGASAVYGADAVAGVVNFILNTHFEGVKVDGGYHFSMHDNSNQAGVDSVLQTAGYPYPTSTSDTGFGKQGSVVMGSNFNDNKGNATAYVTYDNQGPSLQSYFDYSACSLGGLPTYKPTGLVCGGSHTSAKNGAGGAFFGTGIGPGGFLSGAPFLSNTVDGKTGQFRPFQTSDEFNYGPLNYYQVPNERWTAGAFANYDINSHVNAYTQIMFMRNTQQAQIAYGGDFGSPSFIACADPLLNASEAAVMCNPAFQALQGNPYETYNGTKYPGLNLYIARRNVEGAVPRTFETATDAEREVVGVKGDFGDNVWTYNVYGQHGTVDTSIQNLGYLANNFIQEALNCLPATPGSKTPVCGGPTNFLGVGPLVATAATGGSGFAPAAGIVPWNIWTPNGVTPSQVSQLYVPVQEQGIVQEYIADASVTGDLGKYGIKLPTADSGLQINVGAEWREEYSQQSPDYVSEQGAASGSGGATVPVTGEFTVKEVFTELRLPLASHQPFADDLSIEGGYRYSKYSEGFDTNTYKAGLEWAPVRDVRARFSYQRAVRAPNIGELYTPPAVGLDGSVDPCAVPLANPAKPTGPLANGATFAQCALSGVTAAEYGTIISNSANQYNGLLGGNPHLKPEVADTYTAGFVLSPRFVPNLTVTVDWFHIQINDVIGPLTSNAILAGCVFNNGPAEEAYFCPKITRGPGGSLWLSPAGNVADTDVNLGQLRTEGIDLKASYRQPLPQVGSLLFTLEGTRTIELITEPVATFPNLEWNCVGYFGATCGGTGMKWRHVFNTTWSTPWDGLDLNLRWRYYGPQNSETTSGNPLLASGNLAFPGLAHIPAYSYFDLEASFNLYKNVRLQLGANNLFDKAPPLVLGADCSTSTPFGSGANCNGNTFPGVYDALGRYLFMTVSAQF